MLVSAVFSSSLVERLTLFWVIGYPVVRTWADVSNKGIFALQVKKADIPFFLEVESALFSP